MVYWFKVSDKTKGASFLQRALSCQNLLIPVIYHIIIDP